MSRRYVGTDGERKTWEEGDFETFVTIRTGVIPAFNECVNWCAMCRAVGGERIVERSQCNLVHYRGKRWKSEKYKRTQLTPALPHVTTVTLASSQLFNPSVSILPLRVLELFVQLTLIPILLQLTLIPILLHLTLIPILLQLTLIPTLLQFTLFPTRSKANIRGKTKQTRSKFQILHKSSRNHENILEEEGRKKFSTSRSGEDTYRGWNGMESGLQSGNYIPRRKTPGPLVQDWTESSS